MKEFFKKAAIIISSFMALGLGAATKCFSIEPHTGQYRKDIGLITETHFSTKFSENVSGTVTTVNVGQSLADDSITAINDWTTDNYTFKSPLSLNDFYVKFWNENLSGGAGFRTFPDHDGLVSALQDIEYQFFPVDATSPLIMKRIAVPSIWGKYYFRPDSYIKLVGYETIWSKISPEVVSVLKHMKLENPTGTPGYSFLASIGTRFDDTSYEVGFTRGWGAWPSQLRKPVHEFSPNPYKLSAAYVKARKYFDNWSLGGTALVKNANENAGSIYNMLFSVDKKLTLWRNPVSLSVSYFYVQSFEQSKHLRTSPWEDLGNSFSLRSIIEDKEQKTRHGVEGVVNPEEHGYYLTGFSEKRISNTAKVRTQLDFIYDGEKYISDEYDSIRIGGFVTFTF